MTPAVIHRTGRALRLTTAAPRSHDPPPTTAITPHTHRNQHTAPKPCMRQADGPAFMAGSLTNAKLTRGWRLKRSMLIP